jgi:tRNA1(Val) A37 N6-methylase TrmN6
MLASATSFVRMDAELTEDAVLGGRLTLKQPKRGHRVGHDAILLAAATAAAPGERAVDLGAGVGAAGLALAVRVGVAVALIDIDRDLVALAEQNIARNGLGARVRAVALDVAAAPEDFAAAGLSAGCADHVLMNPPFNSPERHKGSPDLDRRTAHLAATASLRDWTATAGRLLRSAGTLTLIWRAEDLADVLATLAPQFGSVVLLPVHGRAGQPAIRILLRATKAGRAPLTLLEGLVLNDRAGQPTAQAEAVLRAGAALALG